MYLSISGYDQKISHKLSSWLKLTLLISYVHGEYSLILMDIYIYMQPRCCVLMRVTEIKNNIIIYVLAVNYMVVKRLTFIPIQ